MLHTAKVTNCSCRKAYAEAPQIRLHSSSINLEYRSQQFAILFYVSLASVNSRLNVRKSIWSALIPNRTVLSHLMIFAVIIVRISGNERSCNVFSIKKNIANISQNKKLIRCNTLHSFTRQELPDTLYSCTNRLVCNLSLKRLRFTVRKFLRKGEWRRHIVAAVGLYRRFVFRYGVVRMRARYL